MAKITLIGLAKYNKHLFDNMQLPDKINKELLIDNILIRGGDFEIMYPDADLMQTLVANWSKKWIQTFTRWAEAIAMNYDPLYNYDRFEEWTDDSKGKGHSSDATGSTSTNVTSGEAVNKVSAFDSSAFVNDSDSITNTNGSAQVNSGTQRDEETENANKHKGHIYGNIGVTTSSAMLLEYLDAQSWSVYDHITDVFLREFVIPIY